MGIIRSASKAASTESALLGYQEKKRVAASGGKRRAEQLVTEGVRQLLGGKSDTVLKIARLDTMSGNEGCKSNFGVRPE